MNLFFPICLASFCKPSSNFSLRLRRNLSDKTAVKHLNLSSSIQPFIMGSTEAKSNLGDEVQVDTTHISSSFTKYEELLRELYYISNKKRGLQNMIELYDALDKPLDSPKISIVHVAGTNGKGSVTLKIARSLEKHHKVGMLVSPHISSFRERISINGTLISEQEVETYLPQVIDLCNKHNIPATFFEIATGLAFLYFAKQGVDVVVLETGLGGRLDATNVVNHPYNPHLCIVTSIGLEHTAILGNTVELIGAEKAGVIKKNASVLVGPNVPHDVIRKVAIEMEAEGYYTADDVLGPTNYDGDGVGHEQISQVVNGMEYVDYDVENSRTARAAIRLLQTKRKNNITFPSIKLSDSDVSAGVCQRPQCRFETVMTGRGEDVHVILDIAHNPPAMITLVAKLEATYPNKHKRYVVGFSADKDIAQIGKLLLSFVPSPSNIHLVEAVNLRAAKICDILEAEPLLKESNFVENDRSITAQVKLGTALAMEKDEILVICGSVFLMAEARAALGIQEARDSDNITNVAGKGLLKCKEEMKKNA
uniref:Mur ligase C-terminal domain-containing protein n=1 Tax=Chaetoceros debilis TaxID=122233 RepID=A0A7S3Q101_9STRA